MLRSLIHPSDTTTTVTHAQVVGGKRTESGRLGAFVIKVKRGSVADSTGHLKRGDEVIMWNKNCLQDATYNQVCDAILASKSERLVSDCLFVCAVRVLLLE